MFYRYSDSDDREDYPGHLEDYLDFNMYFCENECEDNEECFWKHYINIRNIYSVQNLVQRQVMRKEWDTHKYGNIFNMINNLDANIDDEKLCQIFNDMFIDVAVKRYNKQYNRYLEESSNKNNFDKVPPIKASDILDHVVEDLIFTKDVSLFRSSIGKDNEEKERRRKKIKKSKYVEDLQLDHDSKRFIVYRNKSGELCKVNILPVCIIEDYFIFDYTPQIVNKDELLHEMYCTPAVMVSPRVDYDAPPAIKYKNFKILKRDPFNGNESLKTRIRWYHRRTYANGKICAIKIMGVLYEKESNEKLGYCDGTFVYKDNNSNDMDVVSVDYKKILHFSMMRSKLNVAQKKCLAKVFASIPDPDDDIDMSYFNFESGDGTKYFYLAKIWVYPQFQKHGIGSNFLNAVMNHVKSLGASMIYLKAESLSLKIEKLKLSHLICTALKKLLFPSMMSEQSTKLIFRNAFFTHYTSKKNGCNHFIYSGYERANYIEQIVDKFKKKLSSKPNLLPADLFAEYTHDDIVKCLAQASLKESSHFIETFAESGNDSMCSKHKERKLQRFYKSMGFNKSREYWCKKF